MSWPVPCSLILLSFPSFHLETTHCTFWLKERGRRNSTICNNTSMKSILNGSLYNRINCSGSVWYLQHSYMYVGHKEVCAIYNPCDNILASMRVRVGYVMYSMEGEGCTQYLRCSYINSVLVISQCSLLTIHTCIRYNQCTDSKGMATKNERCDLALWYYMYK